MEQEIVITNESDAYDLLNKINEGLKLDHTNIRFEGWPKLKIHLVGSKYDQTITPTMMRGFLELQHAIYRSYTLSTYNSPNTRLLKKEEKDSLEIQVRVSDGSSNYEIDLQEIFIKFIETTGGKMDSLHIVTTVISIAVLFFGTSAVKSYLENRKDIREKELKSEEQRAQIEALKFVSEQETERTKIMSRIIERMPQIRNIENSAHDIQTTIIRSFSSAEAAEFQDVSISPEAANILTANARRRSQDIRLDGQFKILRVDSTDLTEFKVRIKNVISGDVLDATVQDSSLDQRNKPILQEAEWSRTPVELKINAKLLQGEIRNAIIIGVERVVIVEESNS